MLVALFDSQHFQLKQYLLVAQQPAGNRLLGVNNCQNKERGTQFQHKQETVIKVVGDLAKKIRGSIEIPDSMSQSFLYHRFWKFCGI